MTAGELAYAIRQALNVFDNWNDTTGAIQNRGWRNMDKGRKNSHFGSGRAVAKSVVQYPQKY